MRHRAWMLLVGLMIGCGQSGTVTNTNQAATPKTANVPAEVEKLFEQGEVAKAIETLNGLLESKPQEVTLLALRATAHRLLAHAVKAMEGLNSAMQIDGKEA